MRIMYILIIAAPQLVQSGNIDYLVADYLSEITMSLLTSAKHKSPVSTFLPNTVCTIMCVHIGAWYNTYRYILSFKRYFSVCSEWGTVQILFRL